MAKKKKKKGSGWKPGILDGPDPTPEELIAWINAQREQANKEESSSVTQQYPRPCAGC